MRALLLLGLLACASDHELRVVTNNPDARAHSQGAGDSGGSPEDGADAGPGDAGPGDAGPGDAGPGDAGPGDAGPGDAGPGDAGPGDAGPGDAGPGDAGSGEVGPGDAGPLDAEPGDSDPGDTAPDDAAPGDTGPGDTSWDAGPEPPDVVVETCDATVVLGCDQSAEVPLGPAGTTLGCGLVPEPFGSAHTVVAAVASAGAKAELRLVSDSTPYSSAQLHRLLSCDTGGCSAIATEARFDGEGPLFAVVDDWLGATGTAALTVSCCTPDCDGKSCGPDGCGGTCGECAGACQDGACVPCPSCACVPSCEGKSCGPDGCGGSCGECVGGGCLWSGSCAAPASAGERCNDAVPVTTVPWEGVYTSGAADDVTGSPDPDAATAALEGCMRSAPGGRDRVFRVVPPSAGTLEIWLEGATDAPCGPSGGAACPPALVHVSAGCPIAECLASGDFLSPGAPRLRVPVVPSKAVYVTVDGYDASDAGPFHLRIDWAP